MSDKAAETKKKLKQNADKITIGVLGAILLVLGYFWWQEQNSNVASANAEGRPAAFQDNLAENPAMSMLKTMTANPDITQNPDANRLVTFSMFDATTQAAEQQAEQQAVQKIPTANQMIQNGQTEEARQMLEDIVSVARYNKQAVQLLDSITTRTEAVETDANAMPVDPGMPL